DSAFSRGSGKSWRKAAARRRVQAADLALRFPGNGRRGIEAAAEGEESDGAGDSDGSDERSRRGPGSAICGCAADRGAEYAELHVAEGFGKMRTADSAEARAELDGERAADERRIHRGTW